MYHENEQHQVFYILKHIDYSQNWEEIEEQLGFDLGDHSFISKTTYKKVKEAAKIIWAVFNGYFDKNGNPII